MRQRGEQEIVDRLRRAVRAAPRFADRSFGNCIGATDDDQGVPMTTETGCTARCDRSNDIGVRIVLAHPWGSRAARANCPSAHANYRSARAKCRSARENHRSGARELPFCTCKPPIRTRKLPIRTREMPFRTRRLPFRTRKPPFRTREMPIRTCERPVHVRKPAIRA